MKTEIVSMSREHISGIAAIEKECFSQPWSELSLSQELENDNAHFFVCTENGKAIGYIGCIFVCGEGSITNIAVSKSARRRGIATRLIKKLIEFSKDENSDALFLEVRISNIPAISLYKKFGFSVCSKRPRFYRNPTEDGYIMKLSLN